MGEDDNCSILTSWSFTYETIALYILAGFGCIGNIVSFAVIASSKMRKKPIGLYLLCLALSDTAVLILEMLMRNGPGDSSELACISINYIRYTAKSTSVYLVVMIGIHRCITITAPHKSKVYTSPKRAVYHITSLVLFAALTNIYAPLSNGLDHCHECNITKNLWLRFWMDLIFGIICVEIGSSIAVIILTIITVRSLISAKHTRRRLSTSQSKEQQRRVARDIHLTQMLVAVMVCFVVLRVPYSSTWIGDWIHYDLLDHQNDANHYRMVDTMGVLITLSTANFAVNFFLYLAFWPAFRKQMVVLIRKMCHPSQLKQNASFSNISNISSEASSRRSSSTGSTGNTFVYPDSKSNIFTPSSPGTFSPGSASPQTCIWYIDSKPNSALLVWTT